MLTDTELGHHNLQFLTKIKTLHKYKYFQRLILNTIQTITGNSVSLRSGGAVTPYVARSQWLTPSFKLNVVSGITLKNGLHDHEGTQSLKPTIDVVRQLLRKECKILTTAGNIHFADFV